LIFPHCKLKEPEISKNSLCSNLKYRKTQTLPPYVQFFAIAQIEQRPPVGGGNLWLSLCSIPKMPCCSTPKSG